MSDTIDQLFTVRSRLADELASFLDAGVVELDRLPYAPGGCPLTVREVFFEPVVLLPEERRNPSRPGRDGNRDEDNDGGDSPGNTSLFEDMTRSLYEHERSEETHEPRRWVRFVGDSAFGAGPGGVRKAIAVIGAPGGGKTCATRWAVIERATRVADDLRSGALLPDEVVIPLWVTAKALGSLEGKGSAADGVTVEQAGEALLGAWSADTGHRIPDAVRALFLRDLEVGRVILVVDSLDEVPAAAEIEQRLTLLLKVLAGSQVRLIVTCRTKDWDARRGLVPFVMDKPAELAPLRVREHREFARRFFTDAARRAEFERRLAGSPNLRRTSETPLLLTYCALLFADRMLPDDATLAEIYGLILRQMMSGSWRDTRRHKPPHWATDRDLNEPVLRRLAAMAWQFFVAAPEKNEFSHSQADAAFHAAGPAPMIRDAPGAVLRPMLISDLTDGLRVLGIIVAARAGKGGEKSESFAHRTILEYLAAWHVHLDNTAAAPWPGPGNPPPGWNAGGQGSGLLPWILTERRPFHFEPAWLQFLTFTAALLGDATPLLEALEREPENIFRSMFGLQCQLLGVAPKTPEVWADRLVARWGDWRVHQKVRWFRRFFSSVVRRGIPRQRHGEWENLFEWLSFANGAALAIRPSACVKVVAGFATELDPKRETNKQVRADAAKALGRLGVPEALPVLKDALDSQREIDREVRYSAVEALGRLGVIDAFEVLKDALDPQREADPHVRAYAAKALGRLGGPEALPVLKDALDPQRENDGYVRLRALEALGRLGEPEALPALLDALDPQRETDKGVRYRAAEALGQLGVPESLPALLDALDPNRETFENVRYRAAEALGLMGLAEALPALKDAFDPHQETNLGVRCGAAEALGRLGVPEAFELLKNALDPQREPSIDVRYKVLEVMCGLGEEEAFEALKNALDPQRETDQWVRAKAAGALCRLERPEAFRVLKDALDPGRETNERVRCEATKALGRLGVAEALPALKDALDPEREASGTVRYLAVIALGRLGLAGALPLFEGALDPRRETNKWVRIEAAKTLGRLGMPEALPMLKSALDPRRETNIWVRADAAKALAAIAFRIENAPLCRPGGMYAPLLYQIPKWLMPDWRK